MEKVRFSREMEGVADLFISPKGETRSQVGEENSTTDSLKKSGTVGTADDGGEIDIEETISIRRKIAFLDSPVTQEDMKAFLMSHLNNDYLINRIELKKNSSSLKPGKKKNRDEEIIIVLKESPSRS